TPVTCEPLPPSSSCALAVTFVPKSAGKIVGSLTIFNSQTAPKVLQLTGVGLQSCNAGPDFWSKEEFFSLLPVLLIIGFYLAGVLLVRWNMIARPSRHLVKAEIAAVRQRVEALPPQSNASTGVASIRELLDRAQDLVSDAQASKGWDYFFWTRGHELAAWSFIHEAEEQLVYFLPEQSVRAELERAESDLRDAGTTTAVALADRIHEALAAVPVLPLDDPTRKTLEAVLQAFQSQRINIENEVNAAFAPGVTIQIAQWRALAQRVLGFITPQTASLADQIRRALNDPASWEEDWRQLLERAADLLESDAAKLAATLKEFCAADGVSLPEPTEDEWKAALEKAREFFTPHASLVNQIQTTLAAKPLGPVDRWRALHSEALSYLYDRSDTQFAQLVSWQNKTVWLVGISVLLIVSLAATLQHGMLFLVGATGGLLSRLTRSLSRQDVPTDYGASWSTLFLSPVIGALAGWSGILLIIVGVEFNILGSALKFDWCNSFNPVMLGIALLLGTSERFFDKILSKLDEKLGETPSPPQAPPAPPPTPPAPPALPAVTPSVLPEGKVGQAYSQPVTASGGTPPYQWSVASGQLPSGLTLDPTGQISGTPATPESAKFSLQVTDVAAAKSLPVEFSLVIT
ncbi:MAG TPA: putative Ig domain-containing protein, partial [Pyrinomonadaceae bacterium]